MVDPVVNRPSVGLAAGGADDIEANSNKAWRRPAATRGARSDMARIGNSINRLEPRHSAKPCRRPA
jgi:hypothetical protein